MTTKWSTYWFDDSKPFHAGFIEEFCTGCGALCGTKIMGDCMMCTGAIRSDKEYNSARTLELICPERAQEAYENSTKRFQSVFGEDHPVTMEAFANYGNFLARLWKKKQVPETLVLAQKILAESLERKMKFFAGHSWMFEDTRKDLAWVEFQLKKMGGI
jgi:hypothetical protein